MPATNATDNVAKFLTGAQRGDVDQMMRTLSADAELVSPLSGRMVFRGHDDLRTLLSAVYGGLKDTRWQEVVGEGKTRVALGGGRIAGVTITDALVLELDDVGRIRRIRPHLRPLRRTDQNGWVSTGLRGYPSKSSEPLGLSIWTQERPYQRRD